MTMIYQKEERIFVNGKDVTVHNYNQLSAKEQNSLLDYILSVERNNKYVSATMKVLKKLLS